MRSEDVVPNYQRYLSVEGHLSSKTKQLVRKGLPNSLPLNSRVCFLAAAYADLLLPKEFDTLFGYHREETVIRHEAELEIVFRLKHLATATFTCVRIVAVTQQLSEALQEIPDGFKTIGVLEFPDGVPPLIDDLPTLDDWNESGEAVALCSRETLQAIKQRRVAA